MLASSRGVTTSSPQRSGSNMIRPAGALTVCQSVAAYAAKHAEEYILTASCGHWKKAAQCATIAIASAALLEPSSRATCTSQFQCGSLMMVLQSCAASRAVGARGRKVFGLLQIASAAPRSHMKFLVRKYRSAEEMFQRSSEVLAFATLVISGQKDNVLNNSSAT